MFQKQRKTSFSRDLIFGTTTTLSHINYYFKITTEKSKINTQKQFKKYYEIEN